MTAPSCLELFAGGGFAALGVEQAGWDTVALVEINEQAQCVLRAHFDAPILSDVREVNGADRPCDMVRGGSPCQDLSVAGKRAGLAGSRSNLFHEQIRIWRESSADLCLWENVRGAMSSNRGRDFARVLSAFVGGPVPVPRERRRGERKPWPRAGVVSGPAGVAAWRVFDAQYVSTCDDPAVPQRRERVFVLGTRTGRVDPAEILLEPEGVRWDSPPRRTAGEGTAADAGGGATIPILEPGKRTGVSTTDPRAGSGIGDEGDPMYTLQAGAQHGVVSVPDVAGSLGGGSGARGFCDDLDRSGAFPVVAFHHTQDPISGDWSPRHGDQGMAVVAADDTGLARCVTAGEGARGDWETTTMVVSPAVGIPRCLTPRECERLMGAPDDWTLVVGPNGKLLSDAARYRIIGNGEVVQQAQWIAERIRWALERAA